MSNKHEIEEELHQAEIQLANLCQTETRVESNDCQTVTIQPTCGEKMNALREECSQLRAILEAMEASED